MRKHPGGERSRLGRGDAEPVRLEPEAELNGTAIPDGTTTVDATVTGEEPEDNLRGEIEEESAIVGDKFLDVSTGGEDGRICADTEGAASD